MKRHGRRIVAVLVILSLLGSIWLFMPGKRYSDGYGHPVQLGTRLRYVGLATHDWAVDHRGKLVVNETPAGPNEVAQSWSTELLPYLDQEALHERIDREQPWNSPNNREWFQCGIEAFHNPEFGPSYDTKNASGYGLTHFATNSRVATSETIHNLDGISRADGQSNTLMHGEVMGNFMPWGQPGNWRDPAIGLNTSPDGFGSHDRGDVAFLFWDGSFRELSPKIDRTVLRALATPDARQFEKRPEPIVPRTGVLFDIRPVVGPAADRQQRDGQNVHQRMRNASCPSRIYVSSHAPRAK